VSTGSGSFWIFSLAVYGRPGVAPALLGLQDRLGLDVNMLMFCCWAAVRGRSLSAADFDAVEAAVEPWQTEVVRPLRALRRRLKGGFAPMPAAAVESYRKRLGELEIDGEHFAQDAMEEAMETVMESALPKTGSSPADAALTAANLKAYFAHEHKEIGDPESAALTTILQGCHPEVKATFR